MADTPASATRRIDADTVLAKLREMENAATEAGEHDTAFTIGGCIQQIEWLAESALSQSGESVGPFQECDYIVGGKRTAVSSTREPELTLDDVIAWADGVLGAYGTEHANKIAPREGMVAEAVMDASKREVSPWHPRRTYPPSATEPMNRYEAVVRMLMREWDTSRENVEDRITMYADLLKRRADSGAK